MPPVDGGTNLGTVALLHTRSRKGPPHAVSMERDPQCGSGSLVESADLIGVSRAALAILAQLRELRVDLRPATVTAELVRDLRIIQAQLARHDALCGPLAALTEPYEAATL